MQQVVFLSLFLIFIACLYGIFPRGQHVTINITTNNLDHVGMEIVSEQIKASLSKDVICNLEDSYRLFDTFSVICYDNKFNKVFVNGRIKHTKYDFISRKTFYVQAGQSFDYEQPKEFGTLCDFYDTKLEIGDHENACNEAKKIVLDGLEEHWGVLDYSLNPDLNDIQNTYINNGDVFKLVFIKQELVATGALIHEEEKVARIVRMSVKKEYRNQGIGKHLLNLLVNISFEKKYSKIVVETTSTWTNVEKFYKSFGFEEYSRDDDIHMQLLNPNKDL